MKYISKNSSPRSKIGETTVKKPRIYAADLYKSG